MLFKQSIKQQGFTFIELLVVIAIIGVLSGGSLVGFNRLREKRQVLADANKVVEVLKKARTKATSGEKPDVCIGELLNYGVEASGATVSLKIECSNSGESSLETSDLQHSVFSGPVEVSFDSLGGAQAGIIQVCGDNGRYGYDIEITDSGLIESPVENGGC